MRYRNEPKLLKLRCTVNLCRFILILWNCLRAYRMENQRWLLWQLWLGTVIPLMDETIQLFTEGRSGQISDVWLDMSGVLAGGCVMILCYVAVKRKSGGDSEMA